MKAYRVIRTDRAAGLPSGMGLNTKAVYYAGRDFYGCASDDTRATGIEHIAISSNASGEPFFTIPREDVEPTEPESRL